MNNGNNKQSFIHTKDHFTQLTFCKLIDCIELDSFFKIFFDKQVFSLYRDNVIQSQKHHPFVSKNLNCLTTWKSFFNLHALLKRLAEMF